MALRCAASALATLGMALVLVFLVELIVRGSLRGTLDFFLTFEVPGWSTVLLFALALVALDAVLGRAHLALLLVAPAMLVMAWISHEKTYYLGAPLYPVDFLYARQVIELLPLLARSRPLAFVSAAAALVAAAVFLAAALVYWCRRRERLTLRGRAARLALALPVLVFFASVMDYSSFSWARDRLRIIPMMWDQQENYSRNGFTAAFILNVPMANVSQPNGYSREAVAAIRRGAAAALPSDLPDIIVVMNESFWDATRLPNTTITPDPIPVVRANQSGSVFSPEFGGTTANVEFEALTGFSNAFLPYGSIPYQQYVRRPVPSLASFLKAQGYATRALHPYAEWFWNRSAVYRDFGFDVFLSQEKLPPLSSHGPLVSDAALFEEMMREAGRERQPFFYFAVTLQNHGPYEPFRYLDPTLEVETGASDAALQSILTYAEGTADGDRAFARLVEWAEKRERNTVIAMFGDHLPPLGPAYVETGFLSEPVAPRKGTLEKMRLYRETPLVVWSKETGTRRGIGTVSPAFLPLYVLETAGIRHPYYTGFLGKVRERYRVIDRNLLVGADEAARQDWLHDALPDPLLGDFRLLQYDLMFGKGHALPGFFPEMRALHPGA